MFPRSFSEPVLSAIVLDAPADNGDLVVDLREPHVLLVDTTVVLVLERVGGLDTAGDWSVLVDLGLHLVSSGEAIVVGHIVVLVLDSPAFVLAGLADWAWWPGAVLALVDGLAVE
jgi:hypothetical protein